MKQTVAKSLVFLIFACLTRAEACAGSSDFPYFATHFNDCCNGSGDCGRVLSDASACVSPENNKKPSCPTVKKIALQEGTTKPETSEPNHLKEFLAMAESGAFEGKTVYLDSSGTLARGIFNLPLDHWKSFTQRVVMKGWQKDPRLDPKLQRDGIPQVLLDVETKTGHKFVIHLTDDSTIKKALNQQQSKSQQPSIEHKL